MTPTSKFPSHLRHVEQRVFNGDLALHVEALFNESTVVTGVPPMLLLSPAEAPSSRWPRELLVGLAEESAGVIWFDTRDCGRSSWTTDPYSLGDLVADAVAVLDGIEVDRAVVVGQSMGGEIAQRLAVQHAGRVASLVLLSTTPGRAAELAPPEEWLIDKMTQRLFDDLPLVDEDRAQWIAEQQEWFAGPVFGFDRDKALVGLRDEVTAMWRGTNLHGHAVVEAGDIRPELAGIRAPTLVVHGTADPVYPVVHGEALAELIPNAQLKLIEGLGHELPIGFVPTLVELILARARR